MKHRLKVVFLVSKILWSDVQLQMLLSGHRQPEAKTSSELHFYSFLLVRPNFFFVVDVFDFFKMFWIGYFIISVKNVLVNISIFVDESKFQKKHLENLFNVEMFCNIVNAFIVTFVKLMHLCLLKKMKLLLSNVQTNLIWIIWIIRQLHSNKIKL